MFFAALSASANNDDTLTVGILNAPLSLKSWQVRDGISTLIGYQMHRGLIRINPENGNYQGVAAKSWSFDKSQTTISFDLDLSLKFHDGSSLTCELVKASFVRIRNRAKETTIAFPENTSLHCSADGAKFQMQLPYIPAQLLDTLASPAAAITKEDGLIGLGPYALKSQNNSEVNLTKFSGNGPAQIKFVISDQDTLINKFKDKEVDDLLYLGFFTNVNLPCQRIDGFSPTSFWIDVNSRSWAFNAKSNRLLISNLLRAAVEKNKIFDNEILSQSLIPYGVMGYAKAHGKNPPVDISQLRNKLSRLVKENGKIRLTFRTVHQENYNWQALINTIDPDGSIFNVEFLENKAFFDAYYKKQLSVFFIGSNVTRNDPFEVLSFFRAKDFVNPSGVKGNVVDQLMTKANTATESDQVRHYAQVANDWIISEGYALPLFSKRFSACVQPNLSGYHLSPLGPITIDYSMIKKSHE